MQDDRARPDGAERQKRVAGRPPVMDDPDPDASDVDARELPADLATVERLARRQLRARRAGTSIRLVSPGPELVALLELAGLCGVLPSTGTPTSTISLVEVVGQPEAGEDPRGVEEVGDPRDAVVADVHGDE